MRKIVTLSGILVGLSVGMMPAAAQTTVETVSTWDNGVTTPFGEGPITHWGQTFTVPTDNVLRSWTFHLKQDSERVVNFRLRVMQWNGAAERATGPVLYESGVRSTFDHPFLRPYTFETGNLVLTPGAQYVAFMSTAGLHDGTRESASVGENMSAPYGGGYRVILGGLENPHDLSAVTTHAWEASSRIRETAFQAEFVSASAAAVPEPGALALFLPALGAVALARRKRSA